MDLWLTLVVLYFAQCLVRLSGNESLFVRLGPRWRVFAGPGWKLTHPFDDGAALLASRLPLAHDGESLRARERPVRFGLSASSIASSRAGGPAFTETNARRIERRGHWVRVDGRLFVRSATRNGARAGVRLLRDLAGARAEDVEARVRAELEHTLSADAYERDRTRVDDSTRVLAWSTHLHRLLLLAGLPVVILFLGEEAGLQLAFPVLAVTHVFTLVAMHRAHRRLLPEEGDQRFEDVATAAIYPPALLRAHADMRTEVLSRFHPAVHATNRLAGEHRKAFLRAELARLDLALETDGSPMIASLERDALIGFLTRCGESRESLFRTEPEPGTPSDGSFCPVCSAEYLRASGRCVDCGAALIPY